MIDTFLYRLTSPSGKQYIGVTTQPVSHRLLGHKHSKTAIGSAVRKYGDKIKAEILIVGPEQYVYELEKRGIKAFETMAPAGYNLMHGGEGGRHSSETKRKMSKIRKGIVFSETHLQNLSIAHMGHIHSAETKQKMSEAQKRRREREDPSIVSEQMKRIWADRKV